MVITSYDTTYGVANFKSGRQVGLYRDTHDKMLNNMSGKTNSPEDAMEDGAGTADGGKPAAWGQRGRQKRRE